MKIQAVDPVQCCPFDTLMHDRSYTQLPCLGDSINESDEELQTLLPILVPEVLRATTQCAEVVYEDQFHDNNIGRWRRGESRWSE